MKITRVDVDRNLFDFSYELSDGQAREETGRLELVGDVKVFRVTGSYEYREPDGEINRVEYTSGVDGYKVVESGPAIGIQSFIPDNRIDPRIINTLIG